MWLTFLHHGGPPDLTMETGPAQTLAHTLGRLGTHVGFIYPCGLKTPHGLCGMHEPRHTHWYACPLGVSINAIPQLLPLASKSLR